MGNEVAHSGNRSMEAVAAMSAGASSIFSTIQADTPEGKLATLEAVTNAEPVGDHLGETILLRDVIVQATTLSDDEKGERDALRTILIADDGTAYAAVSDGLFKALQNIFSIMGHPNSWADPLPIQVVEVKGRRGYKFFTVKIDTSAKK